MTREGSGSHGTKVDLGFRKKVKGSLEILAGQKNRGECDQARTAGGKMTEKTYGTSGRKEKFLGKWLT